MLQVTWLYLMLLFRNHLHGSSHESIALIHEGFSLTAVSSAASIAMMAILWMKYST